MVQSQAQKTHDLILANHAEMAAEIRILRNENSRVLHYLEDDHKTGQMGTVSQTIKNTEDIKGLSYDKRFIVGVGTVILFIGGMIGGVIRFFYGK